MTARSVRTDTRENTAIFHLAHMIVPNMVYALRHSPATVTRDTKGVTANSTTALETATDVGIVLTESADAGVGGRVLSAPSLFAVEETQR